ncbi:MAG: galactokinase [bacterium]
MENKPIDRLINYLDKNKNDFKYFKAPGRINLIGGHTDYNDGFVLPIAINRNITIACKLRKDNIIKVYSLDFDEEVKFNLDKIKYNANNEWIYYIQGVIKYIQLKINNNFKNKIKGIDMYVTGNIPSGSGLSSSAALELAVAEAFNSIFKLNLNKKELALISQQAENEFVGVSCGIMDQFVSALGKKDYGLFIDCRTLDYNLIKLDFNKLKIVITDTKKKHSLVNSAYNDRIVECKKAVKFFDNKLEKNVKKLRDVSISDFKNYKDGLSKTIRNRAEHVIYENQRVCKTRDALKNNNLKEVGENLLESHNSLKNLYEVSSDELDLLIEIATSLDGVYGSRMTGAGFGGSTINLVKENSVEKFEDEINKRYRNETGIEPDIYILESSDGSSQINMCGDFDG